MKGRIKNRIITNISLKNDTYQIEIINYNKKIAKKVSLIAINAVDIGH